ncbi:hypothetical protein SELMODRAFT_444398 [Selaginella moellendorffii]|uniref:SHSP domain-containing protein n=1 Tax=Selaginella moellendorffii TaxID=88036 RepID=D8S9L8_SELML|nr:hypothetical protein SELMODRAFT_444398 [Selaginella moellendorffii]
MAMAAARAAMAFLVLVAAQACGRDYCSLRQARGCGNSTVEVEHAMSAHKCFIADTVVAATLTDVRRLPNSYLILLEMPGVASSSDVKVEVSGSQFHRVVSIVGISHEAKERRILRDRGAFTKMFAREFVLPDAVDAERISYQLHSGLLRMTLPLVPGLEQTGREQREQVVEEEYLAVAAARVPPASCTISDAAGLIRPEALASNDADDCGGDSSVVTISPLVDIVDRPGSYVVVAEMPGAQSATVDIAWVEDKSGFVLEITGVARDEDDGGEAVRVERGGASTKVFARRLYFPRGVVEDVATYHLSDGLLKVTLPKHVPSLGQRIAGLWNKALKHFICQGFPLNDERAFEAMAKNHALTGHQSSAISLFQSMQLEGERSIRGEPTDPTSSTAWSISWQQQDARELSLAWQTLLGSCKVSHDIQLAKHVANQASVISPEMCCCPISVALVERKRLSMLLQHFLEDSSYSLGHVLLEKSLLDALVAAKRHAYQWQSEERFGAILPNS